MIAAMRYILFAAALLAAASHLLAQRPSFEVVSVKPSAPNCTPGNQGGPTPGRLELPCMTVRLLIRAAYTALSGEQIATRQMEIAGGPGWIDTDRFDISAKADGPATAAQMIGPMLQMLLEERFQLKVHTEPRETPVYSLTVAKGGPKLTPAKEGSCVPFDLNNRDLWNGAKVTPCGIPKTSFRSGIMTADIAGTTMEEFAGRVLPSRTSRFVVDKTSLTGRYDIHLEFSPTPPSGGVMLNGVPQPPPREADPVGPSIFTAIQEQLGLKLSPDKAAMPVVVIDSVQKPAAN